jgi:glycosyltransferase involved in cell wall biosynthesis
MRTALLTFDYPPVPTGLGQAASEIAGGLSRQGVDVTVFTLDREGVERDEATGAKVVGCKTEGGSWGDWVRERAYLGHFVAPYRFFARYQDEVRHNGAFDVAEATNWYAPGLFLADGATPLVVRNSTPAINAYTERSSLRDKTDLRFAHRLEAHTARKADGLISNAPHHRDKIIDAYALGTSGPHRVIALSLDDELIARGRSCPPPDFDAAPTFLFIGRAEKRKGFDEALGAFSRFHLAAEEGRKPGLIIIGLAAGSLKERMKALGIEDDLRAGIEDLGRAGEQEKHDAFCRADFILAPSRYESYGIVYREAAAYGRPLIATRTDPSARDLLSAHPFGRLSRNCSASEIHRTMAEITAHPDRARAMRNIGMKHADSLRRERLGRETLVVYDEVLKRRGTI